MRKKINGENGDLVIKMKRITFLLISVFLFTTCISGCGSNTNTVYPVEIVEEDDTIKDKEDEEVNIEPEEEIESLQPEIVISSETPESVRELTNEEEVESSADEEGKYVTEDGKIVVDLILFMGQSNMSGVGGNPSLAPKVPGGQGFEFKAISDPTNIYPIEEPFGKNESFIGGICDFPGSKQGSLVSSFAIKYYEETGIPIVAVSASEGATTTEKWKSDNYQADLLSRYNKATNWLDDNGFKVRKRFAIWLQGESDAANNVTADEYVANMDIIIRGLFIAGVNKVFIITPGRTLTYKNYFDTIIDCQLKMCKESGYYALGTNYLSAMSAEYLVDEWHYNQYVLDLLGERCAESVAYYVNNQKEMVMYDYKHGETFIPDLFDYTGEEQVEPKDLSDPKALLEFLPDEE